jgi:intracellular septation protein A
MATIQTILLERELDEPPALPHLSAVVRRVAVSLATAVVAPAALFATVVVLANVATAMIVALAWVVGAISWRAATGRTVSGLLLLTLAIMSVKTTLAFATGSTFIYFVQPVLVDAVVAVVFLSSWRSDRPLVARLAPDFCPMDAALTVRPGIRRLFRRLTLMWGLVILVKGGVTLWLLLSLSTIDFVVIKSGTILTLTLATTAATIVWSVIVCRQEGLLGSARRTIPA